MRWKIFDGFANTANVREQKQRENEVHARLFERTRAAEEDVRSAWSRPTNQTRLVGELETLVEQLREAGLAPTDLLKKDVLPAFKPVLQRLIAVAMDHLDQGWLYTMAIPRREIRLRLACMWPILFAGGTLQLVSASPDLLDPAATLKVPRGQVYRIMALTTLTGASSSLWTAYWARLRKLVI